MARKQQLIHLHNVSGLTASAVQTAGMVKGEIAVRHAATNIDSELYTLNNNGDIVTFPSVEKVESLITGATSDNISTLRKEVDELIATVDGYSSSSTIKTAIDGVQSGLQGQINVITGQIGSGFTSGSTIASQLAAVKTTAEDANTQATTNKNSIDTINSVLKGLSGESAVSNAINAAKTKVVAATGNATTDFLTVSDNSKTNPTSGVTYTLTLKDVASAKGLSDLSKKVGTNETDITALKALHEPGKTVAQQVADGIAGVIADAPASFDTLKEIADWIANDTTSSTQMVNDIADLKATLTGYDKTDTVQKAISTVNTNITNINNKIGDGFDSANTVADAIAAAETTITTGTVGGVKVEIDNTGISNGHTNYKISGVGLATSENLTTLSGTVDTLKTNLQTEITDRKNADTAIQKQIGTGFSSANTVAQAVAKAKTTITTANTGFIRIASSTDTGDNHVNYTITANDIASANNLSTLDGAAVKSGEINVDTQKFTGTFASNKLTFNLSTLVIDCGEY